MEINIDINYWYTWSSEYFNLFNFLTFQIAFKLTDVLYTSISHKHFPYPLII